MDHKHYLATALQLVDLKAGTGSVAGSFTAYASTFGNTDHGGDIIEKGAFKNTIRERDFRPLLWQHNMDEPIGIEKALKEDSKGLIGTWDLLDTQRGAEAYKLLKAGAVRSMSIGYMPAKWEYQHDDEDGPFASTRILKEIDLLENSVVSIPMNERALIQSVKHRDHCRYCKSIADANGHEDEGKEGTPPEPKGYDELTLAELGSVLTEVADAFGERTRDLLLKLQNGGHPLTDSKRTELTAMLETFSGLDAVRHDAESLLRDTPEPKPSDGSQSAIALAIELRRRRLRQRGVEV